MKNEILEYLLERYPVLSSIRREIEAAAELMSHCYQTKGKLLVAGNGGSAADAEHIVGELMKGFRKKRPLSEEHKKVLKQLTPDFGNVLAEQLQEALPAISLNGHIALTTAFSNDVCGELGIAQQLSGYGLQGDVFLGISTSGNSKNILYAAYAAKAKGISVIALTGKDGGNLAQISDIAVIVPAEETYEIQELHLPIYHAWCLMLEEAFFQS